MTKIRSIASFFRWLLVTLIVTLIALSLGAALGSAAAAIGVMLR